MVHVMCVCVSVCMCCVHKCVCVALCMYSTCTAQHSMCDEVKHAELTRLELAVVEASEGVE